MSESMFQMIWTAIASGGPIMFALAILSLLLYSNIIGLLVFVTRIDLKSIETREHNVPNAFEATDRGQNLETALVRYENALWQFRQFIQSRLKYTHALLVAAPLLGLLGTVIGMLDTFRGLSLRAGYETMQLVAEGVHRALITTQTGLVIAIPALFLIYWVRRVSKKRELELLQVKVLTFGSEIGD